MSSLTGFSNKAADLSEDSTTSITLVQDVKSLESIVLDLKANIYLDYFEPMLGESVYNHNFIQEKYFKLDGFVELHLKPPLKFYKEDNKLATMNQTKLYRNLKSRDPRRIQIDKIISCPRDNLRTI
jgi:hypothetical protein